MVISLKESLANAVYSGGCSRVAVCISTCTPGARHSQSVPGEQSAYSISSYKLIAYQSTPRPHTYPSLESVLSDFHKLVSDRIASEGTPRSLGPVVICVTGCVSQLL